MGVKFYVLWKGTSKWTSTLFFFLIFFSESKVPTMSHKGVWLVWLGMDFGRDSSNSPHACTCVTRQYHFHRRWPSGSFPEGYHGHVLPWLAIQDHQEQVWETMVVRQRPYIWDNHTFLNYKISPPHTKYHKYLMWHSVWACQVAPTQ